MDNGRIGVSQITGWVVGSGLMVVGLSILLTIQDYSQSIPAALGLGMIQAAIVLAIIYWFHVIAIMFAAAEQRTGYIGSMTFGGLWLLLSLITFPAQGISQVVAGAMIIAALVLVISSVMALRQASIHGEQMPVMQ